MNHDDPSQPQQEPSSGDEVTPPRTDAGYPQVDPVHQEFSRIVFQFEDAWQQGIPDIKVFLPETEPLRSRVLWELVRIDFEYRSERNQPLRPADYLKQFPELGADTLQFQSLMKGFHEATPVQPEAAPLEGIHQPTVISPQTIVSEMVLGNYEILDRIKEGGMGAVFKARHKHMGRIVAIKTIAPSMINTPEAVERFRREVLTIAALDHPNIVIAHDADQFHDIHVLVMQYVEGCDLSTHVRTRGPMSIDLAIDVIRQAALGLEYAHKHKIIHRDIKPSNLILNSDGQLKILDLGLAQIEEAISVDREDLIELTRTGQMIGTVDFMSPEQAKNSKNVGPQSDLYSLGCTLHFLLTGKVMYGTGSIPERLLAHQQAEIPQLRTPRPEVPEWLDGVFHQMVAKRPADRLPSMTALLAALQVHSRVEVPRVANSIASWFAARPKTVLVFLAAAVILLITVLLGDALPPTRFTPRPTQHSASTPDLSQSAPSNPPESSESSLPKPTSFQAKFSPLSVTEMAADSKYSLLVNNNILLSPENQLFSDAERDVIQRFQSSLGEQQAQASLFVGSLQIPDGWTDCRVHNTSQEKCLTAWIVLREGQQPEPLVADLDSKDVTIPLKGARKVDIVVILFPYNEAASQHLNSHGLSCKIIPVE